MINSDDRYGNCSLHVAAEFGFSEIAQASKLHFNVLVGLVCAIPNKKRFILNYLIFEIEEYAII